MISPEKLRRYKLFSGFNHDQLAKLAMAGQELQVPADHVFFREGEVIRTLCFVESGEVGVTLRIPDREIAHDPRDHILNNLALQDVTVSTVGPGEMFGWSAIIPPYETTASTWAITDCSTFTINCEELNGAFLEDSSFGYLMLQKVASVMRHRLRDMHVRCLAFTPA